MLRVLMISEVRGKEKYILLSDFLEDLFLWRNDRLVVKGAGRVGRVLVL